jgi:hypothetical protein
VFYLFYNVAYTPMLVAYTLEILPFAIRAKGFALMVRHVMARRSPAVAPYLRFPKNLTVSLSLAFNQFVDPWALDAIGWKYVGVSLTPELPYLIHHSISSTVHGCSLNWSLLSCS